MGGERLAQAGNVAMAEDRPDAGEEALAGAVDLDMLRDEVTHQGLRHRQSERAHGGVLSHTSRSACAS